MASYNTYTGDGSTRNRAITFPFIDRSHVVVTRDGVETTAWEWLDSSTVQFDVASSLGVDERIRRVTPGDERIVDFENGSALLDTNLNIAALQALYVAEEAKDRASEALAIDIETDSYDFDGHRGVNAADPEDAQDLVTKAYADSILSQVEDQVAIAAGHADAAATGASTAAAGATAAEDAQTAVEALLASFDPNNFATAEQGLLADSAIQPVDLATVATSGDYADLGNKPTIPAASPLTKSFESADQTVTLSGALTLAHGMATVPKLVAAFYKCTTSESGYSVGDEVPLGAGASKYDGTRGPSFTYDATNIYVRYGSANPRVADKSTGADASLTAANWRLIVRAYA